MTDQLACKSTPVIKLKDAPNRGGVKFHLKNDFGFVPEEIIVQKVHGRNNAIIVSAVLTQDELKKEEAASISSKKPLGKTKK